jgi:hypothetical protein
MPDPAAFAVEFVDSEKLIPDDLWSACFTPQQEGRWWFRLIEQAGVEKQFRIFYALLRQNGQLAGIVPLFTMELPLDFIVPESMVPMLAWIGKMLPNLSQPQILFVGSPCADEGVMGFIPAVDRRVAMLFLQHAIEQEARTRRAMMVLWKDFPQSYAADLEWLAEREGLFRMTSFPGAVIDLPTGRKEDYFAAMKSSRRRNLRKKLQQSEKNFDAEIEVIQRPDAATLDRIYALFEQTRSRATTNFERLDRRFFESAAAEFSAHFILLREKTTRDIVAFMLCFDLGGAVINKYIGIDYARPNNWYLLFRLIDVAVDWTLSRGGRLLQGGQTGYSAKLEQGHRLVPLTIYGKQFNPVFHWIGKMVTRNVRWATLDDDLAEYVKAHPTEH